jgi:hypothetical protein
MAEAGLTPDGVSGVLDTLNLVNNAVAAQRPPEPTPEARAFSLLKAAISDQALCAELLTESGKERMEAAGLTPDATNGVPEVLNLMLREVANTPEVIKAQVEAINAQRNNPDLQETMNVFSDLKTALSSNIKQTTAAFVQTMWMYTVSFYMGVALVVSAIVFAAMGKEPLIPSIFGGLGTASIVAFFFTKPPERLQSSRASLAQMQCAMLSWYTDFYNDQSILMQENMGNKLGYESWKKSAVEYLHRTDDWMKMLQRAVSQAADISTDNGKSADSGKSTDGSKAKDPADISDPQ